MELMFEHKTLQTPDDYFTGLSRRRERGVYFYRINGCNEAVKSFIWKYYEAARLCGVIIEGKIPNPDEKNLAYFEEIMGMDFQMSLGFIGTGLKKWLPRMNDYQRKNVAESMYDTLDTMRREGKNENMQKNAYIKFMCWLYYRFERIINQLGEERIPKILYEGEISAYELKLITVLNRAGCDVVLLQYGGDLNYLKLDPGSVLSCPLPIEGMQPFPEDFSIKRLQEEKEKAAGTEKLYGRKPRVQGCANAWNEGKGLPDFMVAADARGNDPDLFYNCFVRINGVWDKLTYLNELYQFQLSLKNSGRHTVILDSRIPVPTPDEINSIRRTRYNSEEQMLIGLSANIQYTANMELQRLMNKAFIDILLEEASQEGMNLNRLTNKAVYLLCWLKRYQPQLFIDWKLPEISCLIYLGGCKDENEELFLRFLSRLPVDVLILNPNLNGRCCLEDRTLYEIRCDESLAVSTFPRENADLHMGTAAYHAERELDTLMYQDSGIYRNQQYSKAVSVTLQTMYEEIAILWDQELNYRPNFSIVDDVVNMPVIFAKVSGVKDGLVQQYWSDIKALRTEDTLIASNAPFIDPMTANPMKAHAAGFFKNGRLLRARIREHPDYQYGFLRDEVQDHILDKLQLLIEKKIIRGTFENGAEYTIIATVLNLNKDIVRMIQKFDFTKKNPKFIYINTTERMISLEDTILASFLNLAGFDVVFFVPTGYQNVERFFNRQVMEEHQIGSYVYDLTVPQFDRLPSNARQSWRDKLFKRGN